jgi:hypothetical protein
MALKIAAFLGLWFGVTAAILINTPAKGTDSSRFSDQLVALHEEVFYWHESMYIGGAGAEWKPDWDWYMDLQGKIERFQAELDRAPNSSCANEARAIVILHWPWLATSPADIAGVELRWKESIDKLPLLCGEF